MKSIKKVDPPKEAKIFEAQMKRSPTYQGPCMQILADDKGKEPMHGMRS